MSILRNNNNNDGAGSYTMLCFYNMCMWPFDMLSLFNKQKLSKSQNTYDSRDERNMEDITCFLLVFLDMILLPLRACTAQIVHTVT